MNKSVNKVTVQNCIFIILKDMIVKVGHFTNIKVLFPGVS